MRRPSALLLVHLALWVSVFTAGMQSVHADSGHDLDVIDQFRAERALDRMAALPSERRDAVRASLEASLRPVEAWVREIDRLAPSILCLGETHRQPDRKFVAERLFPHYRIDRLLLETSPVEARVIARRVDAGEVGVGLLGVDIAAVVAAAKARNPDVRIDGLEGTAPVRHDDGSVQSSTDREQRVAERFWSGYEPGARNVLLYGGLHCANWSLWLFHYLVLAAPDSRADGELKSVRLLARDQDASILAFARFAAALGWPAEDLVVADTDGLAAEIQEWFPLFSQSMLGPYDAVVIHGRDPETLEPVTEAAARTAPTADAAFPHWSTGGVKNKPDTGEPRPMHRVRWLTPLSVHKPSTGDIDLTAHGDLFPHPGREVTARKPSTGMPLHVPRREGDFPHGAGSLRDREGPGSDRDAATPVRE
jgi:hypothetical protein